MATLSSLFLVACVIAFVQGQTPSETPTRAAEDYPLTRRYPADCVPSSCDVFIGVAVNAENSTYLDFYMEANAQVWVATGFSASQNMFAADVVVCTLDTTNSMVTAQDTYNPSSPTRNNIIDTVQNTVLLNGSFANGRIQCVVAKSIIGTDVPTQDINLNTDNLYMLYARGNSGTPMQISGHDSGMANRAATNGQINPAAAAAAVNTPAPTAPVPSQTPTRAAEDYPLTRRYPPGCAPSSCEVFIGVATNAENSDYLDFYMEANAQVWVAAGFSASQSMFSADVVVCTLDTTTSTVTAQDTYNPSSPTRNNIVDNVQNTVLLSGNFTNGRISCVVAKAILGVDVPNQDINLNTDGLYMLYARGNGGTPAQISAHSSGMANRAATDGQINPAAAAAAAGVTTTVTGSGVHTVGTMFSIFLAVLVSGITVLLKL